MRTNPFSPSFAILPASFFGRSSYLEAYGAALEVPDSAYRFFFLTGTRGSGKTSLLHQYELAARARNWDVLKATNIDLIDKLAQYAGLNKSTTRGGALRPSVSAEGIGSASLGEVSASVTTSEPISLLGEHLIRKLRCFRLKQGLAIMVDEAQKLERDDAVLLANAVQDVKSAGLPVSLVLCGLPGTYNKVRSYSDVTFMHRMKREKLWTMTKTETMTFLRKSFASVPEIALTDAQLLGIGAFTGGHPYLMQLAGDHIYRLVEDEFAPMDGMEVAVPDELVERAKARSLAEYQENVLDDVMKGVHNGTRAYLEVACELADDRGYAAVADVNARLGKTAQELSTTRAAALNTQVIKAAEYGKLKFALPHYRHIFEPYTYSEPEVADDEWDF